jgi:formate dehydrogenase iron-sulfur subunit
MPLTGFKKANCNNKRKLITRLYMFNSRRHFLKKIAGLSSVAILGKTKNAVAKTKTQKSEPYGVLVDTTACVGCRNCEKACNQINVDLPRKSAEVFEDKTIFKQRRRMDANSYTIVNKYENRKQPTKPVFAKFQCMHCLKPACVSACIVGALQKESSGAVIYDPWKCVGCRYCLAACPFQVPSYEYNNVLTPQVRKSNFCLETRISKGQVPACIQSCPMQVMTFGNRDKMIEIGKQKIKRFPDRYVDHIYGEKEVGGTTWMILSSIPFKDIDLPPLGVHPITEYTEPIQHSLFKWFLPPTALYSTLGGLMWYFKRRKKDDN